MEELASKLPDSSGPLKFPFSLFIFDKFIGTFHSPWPYGSHVWYCQGCGIKCVERVDLEGKYGWSYHPWSCMSCRDTSYTYENLKCFIPIDLLAHQEKVHGFTPIELLAEEFILSYDLYTGAKRGN